MTPEELRDAARFLREKCRSRARIELADKLDALADSLDARTSYLLRGRRA